jgi:hypothetical protein
MGSLINQTVSISGNIFNKDEELQTYKEMLDFRKQRIMIK